MPRIVGQLKRMLARCVAGLDECARTDAQIAGRAEAVAEARRKDAERLREAIRTETDPYKLRGLEAMYVEVCEDRTKAERAGAYARHTIAQEKDRQGTALINGGRGG